MCPGPGLAEVMSVKLHSSANSKKITDHVNVGRVGSRGGGVRESGEEGKWREEGGANGEWEVRKRREGGWRGWEKG